MLIRERAAASESGGANCYVFLEVIMNKDELIAKQQMEIEDLKSEIDGYKDYCKDARNFLNYAEQWSVKCPDFPKVAMRSIVQARCAIDEI